MTASEGQRAPRCLQCDCELVGLPEPRCPECGCDVHGNNTHPPLCLGCDYELTGLTEPRCPECGRAFDPDDSTTFRRREMGPIARWFAAGPTLWLNLPIALALARCLHGASFPDGHHAIEVECGLALQVLGFVWLVSLVACLVVRAQNRMPLDDRARLLRRWLAAPVLAALATVAVQSNLIFNLRFGWSQAALERVAQEALRDPDKWQGQRGWIGAYDVTRVQIFYADDGETPLAVGFYFGGSGSRAMMRGFAYCPDAPPAGDAHVGSWFNQEFRPSWRYSKFYPPIYEHVRRLEATRNE